MLREGGKFTSFEIASKSGCSPASIKHAIKRLLKDVSERLEHRPLTQDEKVERFGHRLGCKIYLYWLDE